MPWVRFEDQFPIHRKVAALKDPAYRIHTEAIFWCSRNLTDGVIRAAEINQIRPRADKHVAEIVDREAWHPADQICAGCVKALNDAGRTWPADGWVIHDYLKYQPSRAQVIKDRDAKTKRQQKWRATKKGVDGAVDASVDGAVDPAPGDASPAPYPPRPEGSGAGNPPRATARRRSAADAGGGGREDQNPADPPPVDWRTLPAAGAPADPETAERARNGAAAARANIRRPPPTPKRNALDELRAITDPTPQENPDA